MYHDKQKQFLSPPKPAPTLEPWQLAMFAAADLISFNGLAKGFLYYRMDNTHCPMGAFIAVASSRIADQCMFLLRHELRSIQNTSIASIVVWNDAPGRTKEEVVSTLRSLASQ